MARLKKKNVWIEVVVLWGGSELGRCQKLLANCSGITAGKGLLTTIRSRVWPRWDELIILVKSRNGLILNPKLPWQGVITDSEGVHVLNPTKELRKIIGISSDTAASLRLDDMSIMIRCGDRRLTKSIMVKHKPGYRGSVLNFFADSGSEWACLAISVVASAILVGSIWWALDNRPLVGFSQVDDLPEKKRLPFIGQSHLSTAPNILQTNLDRFNFVKSVWNFYSDLTLILGFGKDPGKNAKPFGTTIEYYESLSHAQKKSLDAAENAQEKKLLSSHSRGPFISIPTVRGESLDGKTLRIFDKISVLRTSADGLAERRVQVAEQFNSDIGYKYEPKKEDGGTQRAFAKISAGFLGVESDDKMQARQASESAARAAIVQSKIFGKDHLRFGPNNCCDRPVGAPLTQDGFTWLKPKLNKADDTTFSDFGARSWASAPIENSREGSENQTTSLNPILIEKTVSAGRLQIRMCYELALQRNQLARGSMEWRWVIDNDGRPSELNLIKSSIKDEKMVKCVRDKIASWRFPRPERGAVEVRYPFEFTRDKG